MTDQNLQWDADTQRNHQSTTRSVSGTSSDRQSIDDLDPCIGFVMLAGVMSLLIAAAELRQDPSVCVRLAWATSQLQRKDTESAS